MKEVTTALEREEIVQAEKKFVAYHATSGVVFLLLSVYTKLYDKLHNQVTPEHFTYLRTFETISDKKILDFFLNEVRSPLFSDKGDAGSKHLISLSPFLFQSRGQESALGRTPNLEKNEISIINEILTDIWVSYGVDVLNMNPYWKYISHLTHL